MGAPSVDCTDVGTGHAILGGSGTGDGGGVGWVCDPLQAWNARVAASAVSTRRLKRVGWNTMRALATPQEDRRQRKREGSAVSRGQRHDDYIGALPSRRHTRLATRITARHEESHLLANERLVAHHRPPPRVVGPVAGKVRQNGSPSARAAAPHLDET